MNLSKLKRFSSKGFTLIELLIVIAILGVLAAAMLVAIDPVKKINLAKDSTVKSDMAQIVSAMQSYYTAQSAISSAVAYPATLATLIGNELKTLPTQQASNVACPAAPATTTLVTSGTATNAGYYYCYYIFPTTGAVTSVVIIGTLFSPASSTWYCWDSKTAVFKSTSTGAPTVASSELSCL